MDLPTLVRLAQWFERRIDATVDGFDLAASRLYGLVLVDPARLDATPDDGGAARATFVGEDVDIDRLIEGPAGVVARSFDAAAVVSTGWGAPEAVDGMRPSEHPDRRRVRVVAVVSDPGVRSVTRFADAPEAPIVMAERGMGRVIDGLEALWFGDPFALVSRRSPPAAISRACRRRP